MSPLPAVLEALDRRDLKPRKSGAGYVACCPSHEDRKASLSLTEGRDGRVLLKCFTGCEARDIVAALGLSMTDLFDDDEVRPAPRQARRVVATYQYQDEDGATLYEVLRYDPKDFRQRRPEPPGWAWGLVEGDYVRSGADWYRAKREDTGERRHLPDARRVLYGLSLVLAAVKAGELVLYVEGEMDVETARALGFVATTHAGGAKGWRPEFVEVLAGADVVVIPDADKPGREMAETIASALEPVAQRVRVVELPGLAEHGDLTDWHRAGGTAEQLRALIENPPARGEPARDAIVYELIPPPPPPPRPTLADAAFHGLAGRIVRILSPHTEADPLGLLGAFLVTFGVTVGRRPHVRVGGSRHGANLFAALVGPTAEGRKGTAVAEAGRIFRLAGDDCRPPSASGLSSGEGFVYAIRDEVRVCKPVREKGRTVDTEEVVEDPGVADKRLLGLESELGSVFRRMEREGNTLSALMRQAWDGDDLSTLTKRPLRSTAPHVGLVAQITPSELAELMTETEALNGWANRVIFLAVRRPHLLPHGGSLRDTSLLPLAHELREAVLFARDVDEVTRSRAAEEAWGRVYGLLTSDRPGLFGSITARAAQHVIRLSLVYALVDRARSIEEPHLAAALAFWRASEDSARALFGRNLGDSIADDLAVELRSSPGGMTRTEMREFFGRNVSSGRISAALETLARLGLAIGRREVQAGRRGRPVERWHATAEAGAEPVEASAPDLVAAAGGAR